MPALPTFIVFQSDETVSLRCAHGVQQMDHVLGK